MIVDSEIRTAVFISGSGTTMERIGDAWTKQELGDVAPVLVISSDPNAEGIHKAQAIGLPTYVVNPKDYASKAEFGDGLLGYLDRFGINLISQNGWLPLTPESVVEKYKGWIINQHPGPLDSGHLDFGGWGMFGDRVIAARVIYAWFTKDRDEHYTEASVHHATREFDKGNLINVSRMRLPEADEDVPVEVLVYERENDLKDVVRATKERLLPIEHALVIDTLKTIGTTGTVPIYERTSRLVPDVYADYVVRAKNAAFRLYPRQEKGEKV